MAKSPSFVLAGVVVLLSGCNKLSKPDYPAHWWTPVPAAGAPGWEILPQAAGPGEVILSKRNELGILSNFAPTPFVYHGVRYASLEGFWQMMKYPEGPADPRATSPAVHWRYTRQQVAQMASFEAKHAGDLGEANMATLGIDYVTFDGARMPYKSHTHGEHYRLIVEAMREKLLQNRQVQQTLLATGSLILRPDHHQDPSDPDEWRYYSIWMQFRSALQAERKP
jgi:predicted NAD-dependent protein-ADP-ribosyltransferase YbiA (DUF1768 family)